MGPGMMRFTVVMLTCQVDRSLEPFSWASVDVRRVVVGVAQWPLLMCVRCDLLCQLGKHQSGKKMTNMGVEVDI